MTENIIPTPNEINDHTFTPEFGYGGFWRRFTANLLDGLIISIISLSISYTFKHTTAVGGVSGSNTIPGTILGIFYVIFFWAYQNGQTIGKKLVGLRIVKESGQPLDLPTAITRYIGYLLSCAVLCIGLISVAFNPKKQGWHDKLANTLVIKTDNRSHAGWAIAIYGLFFLFIIGSLAVGIFSALSSKNTGFNSVPNITSQLSKSLPTITQQDNSKFENDIGQLIDQKRQELNLPLFTVDNKLCAYAQRQLSQLKDYGKYDDSKGFYEDTNNVEISRTYFSQYKSIGEDYYTKNASTQASEVLNTWLTSPNSTNITDATKNFGCLRSDDNYIILITASTIK